MKVKHPRKWFLIALIAVLLFTGFPVGAAEEGVVTGNVVNVRSGPGLNYQVVTKTEAGQGLSVVNKSGEWLQVRLYNGKEGWIRQDLVKITAAAPAASSTRYGKINTKVLNVRSGPGTNYALVTKIGQDEIHQILEEKDGWYKIALGWVSGDYVVPAAAPASSAPVVPVTPDVPVIPAAPDVPAAPDTYSDTVLVTANNVNIRQAGDISAPVLVQVNQGERLAVTGRQGDWLQVKLTDGSAGWVASWLTDYAASSDPSRGAVVEKEILIAPIAEGKTFKIIDASGRPVLQLEGWTSSQYRILSDGAKITLELEGPTDRNYQGTNSRLGLQNIRIYGQGQKAFIELTFAFAPLQSLHVDEAKKLTRVQVSAIQTQGLAGKVIVIDPGHASVQPGGWLDPGTVGKNGLKEKDVNIDLAYKVTSMLQQAGARVIMTHTGSTSLSLAGRANIANSAGADIFVSIHVNSNPNPAMSGHTTYYYAPADRPVLYAQRLERQKLATVVQQELVKAAGRANQGIMTSNFAVLRETTVPSILVETAFMSNATEMNLLTTDAFRQRLALGIYNGIAAYFR